MRYKDTQHLQHIRHSQIANDHHSQRLFHSSSGSIRWNWKRPFADSWWYWIRGSWMFYWLKLWFFLITPNALFSSWLKNNSTSLTWISFARMDMNFWSVWVILRMALWGTLIIINFDVIIDEGSIMFPNLMKPKCTILQWTIIQQIGLILSTLVKDGIFMMRSLTIISGYMISESTKTMGRWLPLRGKNYKIS